MAVTLLIVALGACGSDSSATPVTVPSVPPDATAAWFTSALPLGNASQTIFDVHRALDNALAREISRCMQTLGFSYTHEDVKSATIQFRRYGLLPGDQPGPYRKDNGQANDEVIPPPPPSDPAYQSALYGTGQPERSPIRDRDGNVIGSTFSQGGCLADATQIVAQGNYAAFASDDLIFQTELNRETDALWVDSDVKSAMRDWQKCMVATGAPEPDRLDFYLHYEWPDASEAEQRRVGQDELRCKQETGVVPKVFTIDYKLQSQVLRQYPELFMRYGKYEAEFANAP